MLVLVRLRRKGDFMVLSLKLKSNCYGGNEIGAKFKCSERVALPLILKTGVHHSFTISRNRCCRD